MKRVATGLAIGMILGVTSVRAQIVRDGGFELGSNNPFWEESSTNFGTPICNAQVCGQFFGGPFEGAWWAWFGGATGLEVGALSQEVVIPPGVATLRFWLDITAASGNVVDFLTVTIDAAPLFTAFEFDERDYHPWTEVVLDVSAFADGGTHLLRFDSTVMGPERTNFFVDAVEITVESGKLPGDADADGDVDLFDFAEYTDCVTGPGGVAIASCTLFDFDSDSDVDFEDLAVMQRTFTGTK